jgi:nucleotide-binding universal stress UspA family protein
MRQRFQHVLLPVDFTHKNRLALEIALEQAVDNRSKVTLLHVIETIDTGDDDADSELRQFYERLERRARSELDSLAQMFVQASLAVEQKVRYGRRAQEIAEFAAAHDVDLIVMSSHRIDPEHPMQSLSTVSYQVSMLCTCPILLVK